MALLDLKRERRRISFSKNVGSYVDSDIIHLSDLILVGTRDHSVFAPNTFLR